MSTDDETVGPRPNPVPGLAPGRLERTTGMVEMGPEADRDFGMVAGRSKEDV